MSTTLAKNLRADRVDRFRLRPVFAVGPGSSVADAVRGMTAERTGCALVIDDAAGGGRLVGIFTERDFLHRVVAAGLESSVPVGRVMSPGPRTVERHTSVRDAVEIMAAGGFRHLPVLDDGGRPTGVLSVKDVLHYLVEYFPAKVYNLSPSPDQAQPAREGA